MPEFSVRVQSQRLGIDYICLPKGRTGIIYTVGVAEKIGTGTFITAVIFELPLVDSLSARADGHRVETRTPVLEKGAVVEADTPDFLVLGIHHSYSTDHTLIILG